MKKESKKQNGADMPPAGNETAALNSADKADAAAALEVDAPPLKIEHILVPIDFSEPSRKALRRAIKFAGHFGARITLLHVVEPFDQPDFAYFPLIIDGSKIIKMAQRKLEVLARTRPGEKCPIETKLVRTGKPFHEITEAARELKVDLIIISAHGYAVLKHALMGSTVERVVRHAPCPVLTLRETEKERPSAAP